MFTLSRFVQWGHFLQPAAATTPRSCGANQVLLSCPVTVSSRMFPPARLFMRNFARIIRNIGFMLAMNKMSTAATCYLTFCFRLTPLLGPLSKRLLLLCRHTAIGFTLMVVAGSFYSDAGAPIVIHCKPALSSMQAMQLLLQLQHCKRDHILQMRMLQVAPCSTFIVE